MEIDWARYASEHQDSLEESDSTFQELVYGDTFTFLALRPDQSSAKVCHQTFCCLAEFSLEEREESTEVFSLGAFRGDHYRDGSVSGHWRMEMCTVIKCDPTNPAATWPGCCDGASVIVTRTRRIKTKLCPFSLVIMVRKTQ